MCTYGLILWSSVTSDHDRDVVGDGAYHIPYDASLQHPQLRSAQLCLFEK